MKIRFAAEAAVADQVANEAPVLETVTKDISTGGIYFSLSKGCQLGSKLECVLFLPPTSASGRPVRVRFRGKVVRVEKPDANSRIGVAATIENYALENFAARKGN